ncbi:RNA-binding protein [Burkholderia pseudomallei]|nr:RNA-binding protein [Burkholderia pseudomallei]CAJ5636532.1 RNA-binding protein [Burkholderia pseudomallei]
MVANRKPQTANRKPQTANRKPQTANRKPQTANRKPQTPNPKPQTPILSAIDGPSGDWPNRPLRPCESTSHPARGRRIRSPGTQAGISFYPPFAVFSRSTSRDARNRCSAEKSRR